MKDQPSLVQFDSREEKAKFVRKMFDRISPRYDLMNRLMTLGQDMHWRRLAIDKANLHNGAMVLDIACGTGDLAGTALKKQPRQVVAADFSLEMLRRGRARFDGEARIRFLGADGLLMPFGGSSFDAVLTGFSMRNVVDIDAFLREMTRVVRPGGRVVILEITPLKKSLLRPLFQFYFSRVVPFIGGILAKDREAYTYLPQSVEIFLRPEELAERMRAAGLQAVQYKLLSMSTVALHWGTVAETETAAKQNTDS